MSPSPGLSNCHIVIEVSITVSLLHEKSYSLSSLEAIGPGFKFGSKAQGAKVYSLASLWELQCITMGFCIVVYALPLDSL